MKSLTLLVFLLGNSIIAQSIQIDTVIVEKGSMDKMVELRLKINNASLDSINHVRLSGKAQILEENSNSFYSDSCYTDNYLDNLNEYYTIVFDSIPNELNRIDNLNGTLRFLYPAESKGSVVRVSNGSKAFNRNIVKDKRSSIKVIPIEGTELKQIINKPRKLRRFLSSISTDSNLNLDLLNLTVSKFIDNFQEYGQTESAFDMIFFYIERPSFDVVDINIYANDGFVHEVTSQINGPQSSFWAIHRVHRHGIPISGEFSIEVILENDVSIKEVEFELSNIKLN